MSKFGNALARMGFAKIFFAAQLALTASVLTNCANQNISDEHSSLTAHEKPMRPSHLRAVARAKSIRRYSPSYGERVPSQDAPEHTGSIPARQDFEGERPTGLIQPDPANQTILPAPLPDPRTLQAMNCRDLMIKEHPTVRFHDTGSATAQRDYFASCMKRSPVQSSENHGR